MISVRKSLIFIFLFSFLSISSPSFATNTKCSAPQTPLVDLVSAPNKFIGKKVLLSGEFYAFSTLPLDYDKAMRSSKEYIGIVLTRPDHKEIPLVELKLAVPLKFFKEKEINIEHGDQLALSGKIFAVELGEPWLDIEEIEVTKAANKS